MPNVSMAQSPRLSHIDTWVFDLDNTLYPASANLFVQIDVRMKTFISKFLNLDIDAALKLQKTYYRQHGTTLRGLMLNHTIDPDDFLDYVHDIDHTVLTANPGLGEALDKLPGRRLIFTNGSESHAHSVLGALGIADSFEAVFDIRAGDYIPKPDPRSYLRFLSVHNLNPASAIMFEDSSNNLKPAADMGMATVLITSDNIDSKHKKARHCHYVTDNLEDWLLKASNGLNALK